MASTAFAPPIEASMRAEDQATRRLLQSGVTVHQITTSDLFCLDPNEQIDRARRELEILDIDQAPLNEAPIWRSVRLHDLQDAAGIVASVAEPIRVDEVVAGSTGLASLLPRFAERDHFYVLDGDGIQGIVTRADLQLPPVSMAVLGLVVSLEMALTDLIATYSHGSWLEEMQDGRREKLLERFEKTQRANAEITELECLDLIDRFDLVGRISALGDALGLTSTNQVEKAKKRVEKLRNPLAHGGSLIGAHEDFDETLRTIDFVQELAARAWGLVVSSPFVWDAYATTRIAPLAPTSASLLSDEGRNGLVHIITAYNPNGRPRSQPANDLANERLRLHLAEVAEAIEEVECGSSSGRWMERSFAATGLSRTRAVEAARRFGQRAIFEIEGDELRVVGCESGAVEREREWPGIE